MDMNVVVPASPVTAMSRLALEEVPIEERPTAPPLVRNIVATASVATRLDTRELANLIPDSRLRNSRNQVLVLRDPTQGTTSVIFGTGRFIVTGAVSEALSRRSAQATVAKLSQALHRTLHLTGYRITNIVASWSTGYRIRLEDIAVQHLRAVRYEPELFPGLAFRMDSPPGTAIVFVNGKVNLVGVKALNDLQPMVERLAALLLPHKISDVPM